MTHGAPPYDPTPAALADAVVQRLEGVRNQLTTFSLGIFPESANATPHLRHSTTMTTLALDGVLEVSSSDHTTTSRNAATLAEEGVEASLVVAPYLDVVEHLAAAEQVVGDVEHVVGVLVRPVPLQDAQRGVEHFG